MIEINKSKLIPGITSNWGDILGDITKQQDLVDYVASHGGGGAVWGSITGDIEDQEDLNNLLDDYALKEWVESKGYLVQDDLSQYATQDWVGQQGYINQIKTVNDQSLIGEGNIEVSGLTPEQEVAVGKIMYPSSYGYLKGVQLSPEHAYYFTAPFDQSDYYNYLYKVDWRIFYVLQGSEVYVYDPDTFTFRRECVLSLPTYAPMWKDNSYRFYLGDSVEITKLSTGDCENRDLNTNGEYIYDQSKHNIVKGTKGIYLIGYSSGYKFDEENQRFESYDVRLPEGIDWRYQIMNFFKYNGHFITYTDLNTCYEFIEHDDYVEIVQVDSYFSNYVIRSGFNARNFVNCGDDLYYFRNSYTYRLNNLSWQRFYIINDNGDNVPMRNMGVDCGEYLLGYQYNYSQYAFQVTNPKQSGVVYKTYWSDISADAVDLNSSQTIRGYKQFSNIGTSQIQLTDLTANSSNTTFHLGKNHTNADTIDYNVSGLFTLNGVDIATKEDCFLNVDEIYCGPRFNDITDNIYGSDRVWFWTTPSGRLFHQETYGETTYEFDGSQFNQVQLSTPLVGSCKKVTTADGELYAYWAGMLYQWDDTNSTWNSVVSTDGDEIWAAGDVLRYGSEYKLVNGAWVSDPISDYKGQYSIVAGGNVYVRSDNKIYQYDEDTKTYTELGSYVDWWTWNWFVFEDEIYYTGGDYVVYKIDLSLAGTDQQLNVPTNILCTQTSQFYGTCQYSNYLYTCYTITNRLGYCYDYEYETPAVPSTNGTYVLKATVQDGEVTYSWVPENTI